MHVLFSDFCFVDVYKVIFEGDTIQSVVIDNGIEGGSVGLNADKQNIQWIALACEDEQTAVDVAMKVMKTVWRQSAA